MLKKATSIRILCFALLLVVSAAAFAQSPPEITVQATPFHRFITQNESLGNFLTANFSEGSCCPYNYRSIPFPSQADIVPLVPGYRPRGDQGLLPVHQWQVHESPRIYYYYSVYYYPHGSNYRYQGVVGYALASSDTRGTPLQYWYSTSYGYYYTLTGEYPPWGSFYPHGSSWNLPVGGSFIFEKIPVPCEGFELQRDECLNGGNEWDNVRCECRPVICTTRFCREEPIEY
jgi:hypothetical protein